jgi:hypothetical protein
MDILAGMLAYVAGIGALIAGLAISFSVFFATPNQPLQTENQPQSASAMLVRPSAANNPAAIGAVGKQSAKQSAGHFDKSAEKHAAAAALPSAAQPTASRELRRKHATSAAQAWRPIQEESARRWAYQQNPSARNQNAQNPSFESRFLGYAD